MYLDACILAKLLVPEADSEACADRVSGRTLVSSDLVYAEIWSMLLRKERERQITARERDAAWAEFERLVDHEILWLAAVDKRIIRQSRAVMLAVHPTVPIRTLDAIHLATYLSVVTGPLYTVDARMRQAAQLLNVPLVA